jgi:hypothetical protein
MPHRRQRNSLGGYGSSMGIMRRLSLDLGGMSKFSQYRDPLYIPQPLHRGRSRLSRYQGYDDGLMDFEEYPPYWSDQDDMTEDMELYGWGGKWTDFEDFDDYSYEYDDEDGDYI